MLARGLTEILQGVSLNIYIRNLSPKAFYLPMHIKVASATNALLDVTHAKSNEPQTVDPLKLDKATHRMREWVEKSNVSASKRRETPISTWSRNADNVVNTIQQPMRFHDQKNKQTQPAKIQDMAKELAKQSSNTRPSQRAASQVPLYALVATTHVGRTPW